MSRVIDGDAMGRIWIEASVPELVDADYAVTSDDTDQYNCIAWAAHDSKRWWWPIVDEEQMELFYWPDGVKREETVDAFVEAYASLGYHPCDHAELEPGYEKVALFTSETGVPAHAARQLKSGRWTSKLGALNDIEHLLEHLNGTTYGRATVILKRLRRE